MVKICNTEYTDETNEETFNTMTGGAFELSPFQKWAIHHTIAGNHVLITAHTGSGKTLPAEFAFKWFTSKGKKVIYASPIKALSNQKLHDMRLKYPDISFGLLTGDVKDNPDADVLIVTTEILRNTLFNMQVQEKTQKEMPLSFSMNIENELGAVVFDEVHYINDPDRGSVWEQSILLLPPHVQLLMLSATINKPEGFAQWIEDQKAAQSEVRGTAKKEVILAPTYERVVPLTHYCWLESSRHIAKKAKKSEIEPMLERLCSKPVIIKKPCGDFNNEVARDIGKIKSWMWDNRCYVKRPHVLNNMARHMKDNNMLPAINFIFSRRHVELAASEIQINLHRDDENYSSTVSKECRKILASKLPNYQEYLNLPEYTAMVGLLEKGIAFHHGGMMQVLKEMVELLFDRGYIKMLFATETFAVGINMPTKTVVFHSLEKWDGHGKRLLAPHEYTQMAGRAGRRGLDVVGHVIHCNNLFNTPSILDYKNMLCGAPQKLTSKFKISYGLILNVVAAGAQNLEKIYGFVSQSMIKKDIDKEVDHYSSEVETLTIKLEKMRADASRARTPESDLMRYIELGKTIGSLSQKQRKKAQREMNNLQETHKTLDKDAELMQNIVDIEKSISNNRGYKENADQYLINEVKKVAQILIDEGYLTLSDTGEYSVTEIGLVASQLQEVHSAAFAKVIIDTEYFKDFTHADIASLISAFTNIRVPDEFAALYPNSGRTTVDNSMKQLQGEILRFHQKELDERISTGESEDIQFNLCASILSWCDCDTEDSCKEVLRQICNERSSIFLGDFIKAILKINNVASEIEKVAEITNNIPLLEKLRQIPVATLKYVANNQSLYI
tara:strand:- start:1129 stop:3654 length:2526 start_codon:yes stop_codon:yes gene_type:complete